MRWVGLLALVWWGVGVWGGAVRYGVVGCGVVRSGVVRCGAARRGVAGCGVVWVCVSLRLSVTVVDSLGRSVNHVGMQSRLTACSGMYTS